LNTEFRIQPIRNAETLILQTSKEDNIVIQRESSLAVTGKSFGQKPGEGFSIVCANK
jgi:hypothetical protein